MSVLPATLQQLKETRGDWSWLPTTLWILFALFCIYKAWKEHQYIKRTRSALKKWELYVFLQKQGYTLPFLAEPAIQIVKEQDREYKN